MASKIRNGTVRLVVMVPQVIEFEFSGNDKLLQSISEHMIETKFPEEVPSAHQDGPVGDFYRAKLMETSVREPDPEKVNLEEMIAPGLA